MVQASAPGKLILFGEHASRHGKPAIVFAVDKRVYASAQGSGKEGIRLNAPSLGISDEAYPSSRLGHVSAAIGAFFKETGASKRGFSLATSSDLPPGLGSSAASVVATLGALDAFFSTKLPLRRIFELGCEAILKEQGFGSGIDVAAAAYGGLLRFEKGKEPVRIPCGRLPLVVGSTGMKAKSGPIVAAVQEKERAYPEVFLRSIDSLGEISLLGEQAILKGDLPGLGELMDVSHGILYSMGVSSAALERLVWAARDAGALGAKLSGAGVGDNMLALARPGEEAKIADAIRGAGGSVLDIGMDDDGLLMMQSIQ